MESPKVYGHSGGGVVVIFIIIALWLSITGRLQRVKYALLDSSGDRPGDPPKASGQLPEVKPANPRDFDVPGWDPSKLPPLPHLPNHGIPTLPDQNGKYTPPIGGR